jgi:hypothetical protein
MLLFQPVFGPNRNRLIGNACNPKLLDDRRNIRDRPQLSSNTLEASALFTDLRGNGKMKMKR